LKGTTAPAPATHRPPAHSGSSSSLLRAYNDPVIFRDERVFTTLLQKQTKYVPASAPTLALTTSPASGIRPEMRKEVADWMLEVCEHQSHEFQPRGCNQICPPEVFCLAMNYVDRFLSACSSPIARSQLQLLGAVCLMVAWKVREHEPLPAQKLVEYSDFALTLDDIVEWEVLLLSKLEWDMSAVIAFDFVEHIIQRLERAEQVKEEAGMHEEMSTNALRSSSEALITMCSGHHQFSSLSPCLIAAACVASTLKSMAAAANQTSSSSSFLSSSSDVSMTSSSSTFDSSHSNPDLEKMFQVIRDITSLNQDQIESCMAKVDAMVKSQKDEAKESSPRSHQASLVSGYHLSPPPATSTPRRPPNKPTGKLPPN